MDDQLELPTSIAPKDQQDDDGESSGDEGMPDWTNIPGVRGLSRAVIPKRGEKEFEPAAGGATALQSHVLTKSRNAMLSALQGSRGAASKTISYAVWYPKLGRAHVTVARGTHFSTLGHSALREPPPESGSTKLQKRLELMPEEVLYLMERGSLFCWKESEVSASMKDELESDFDDCNLTIGTPMSVQQGFTELIGVDGLELQHYLVYAYLKRLGYTVSRTSAPTNTPLYPLAPPNNSDVTTLSYKARSSMLLISQSLFSFIGAIQSKLNSLLFGFHGASIGGMLGLMPRSFTNGSMFQPLRTMVSGHDVPLRRKELGTSSPVRDATFKVFWNVWKPSTPWRKLDVPKPDFEVAVVDARKTPVPDIYQLTKMFASAEPRPPPPPRKRGPPNSKAASQPSQKKPPQPKKANEAAPPSLWDRIRQTIGIASPSPTQKPNPFVHLKAGRKSVIVAAVDGGMVSLVRFGEGDFASWPMV
ncbi:putative tRNA-splicing endonuclease subunit sen54 AltName: Full=tRNA-intron endonuclease sen54 [Rhizoctonia solani AG-1 IB]|uniref:Sen54 protein n=1 Tax=Thanatephorus cucumeris (strain AG1-IB / isolate 7/3/14) TaxID=1108050 RepID=M5C1N8_THACB|nr:putative tRNA-splicing endonuclease subunit sen54 AltName: Full=tRNA-intron endonuclease sen54 [Rhizoctonia solani AG-1 IB]